MYVQLFIDARQPPDRRRRGRAEVPRATEPLVEVAGHCCGVVVEREDECLVAETRDDAAQTGLDGVGVARKYAAPRGVVANGIPSP